MADSLRTYPEVSMRVVVVGGAGAMGRWTVRDLTESEGVDAVVVADLDGSRAREAAGWAAARSGSNGTARVAGRSEERRVGKEC